MYNTVVREYLRAWLCAPIGRLDCAPVHAWKPWNTLGNLGTRNATPGLPATQVELARTKGSTLRDEGLHTQLIAT